MKILRKILFPFSILYGWITAIRNLMYDIGWFESRSYSIPIICVGNLSTGGTGKSPMIEFLLEFLQKEYQVAVLSRGYKRKTKGYKEVLLESTAEEVGDEPLQFKQNFPNCTIAVCANRRLGIEKLQKKAEIILLDDAFQHRKVKASTNILLTTFDDLYIEDYMLPTGNLREYRKGANRADFIVVTKCPEKVAYAKLQQIQFNLKMKPHQRIYFTKIGYDESIYGVSETNAISYLKDKFFTLVTGIANPQPLLDYLHKESFNFEHKKYPDHHHFSITEINELQGKEIILTTEKDFVRLQPRLKKFAIYYLPIKTLVLNSQDKFFKEAILNSIKN
jgi:tetraacyldisaccharide 4'-kinase